MGSKESSWIRCVGGCQQLIKHGRTASGNQRCICKICGKTKVASYLYKAYLPDINPLIVKLTKEGLGIRSTARVLGISVTTLLKRIVVIAQTIKKPLIGKGKCFEVDEMRTFIKRKSKLIWIVYALERSSGTIANFSVGARTNKTLYSVIKTLELSAARKIYTDGLRNYKSIVPIKIHVVQRFGTNHIERKNLTLRTHLKRLNRKTVCFSRSLVLLNAVLKIYFWG